MSFCDSCCTQNSSFLINQTAFVDSKFGDNLTARLQSPAFPYKTINAAIIACSIMATSVCPWQVQIRPGTYTENIGLRDFINLLGVSSIGFIAPPPGNEIIINGSIDDSLIVNGSPDITYLSIANTDAIVANFVSGSLVNLVDCILTSTFTTPTSLASAINIGNGTDVVFRRSHITLSVTSNSAYSATTINLTGGIGSDVVLENSLVDLVLDGVGIATLTNICAANTGNLTSPTIISNSSTYSVGYTNISGIPPSGTYQTFAVSDASVVSRNDDVEFIVVPVSLTSSIVNGEANSQADILNMNVNFVTGNPTPSLVSTFNNNSLSTATGYFNNIRFRNLSGSVPTQTPSNFTNVFRQINVLSDTQLGGQDLVGFTNVSTTPYNVLEIDSMIFYNVSGGIINLPQVSSYPGRKLSIKNTTSTTITVIPQAGNTIDNLVSQILNPLQNLVIGSDGNIHWWIISLI